MRVKNENFEIRMVNESYFVIKMSIAEYLHLFLYFNKHGVRISVFLNLDEMHEKKLLNSIDNLLNLKY